MSRFLGTNQPVECSFMAVLKGIVVLNFPTGQTAKCALAALRDGTLVRAGMFVHKAFKRTKRDLDKLRSNLVSTIKNPREF